ncbi:unnamed protein product, partial [Effrenium voratum]
MLTKLFKSKTRAEGMERLGLSEFRTLVETYEFRSYLQSRGIDIKNAETFFRMLVELQGETTIDATTFANACVRMKGAATSIDLQTVMFTTHLMNREQRQSFELLSHRLARIETFFNPQMSTSANIEPIIDTHNVQVEMTAPRISSIIEPPSRLDAQSSGLVMCALTYEADEFWGATFGGGPQAFLLLQLRQDSFAVAREYLVLCHGFLRQPQELCAPIWTAEESSRVDWAKGQAAKTRLKPVAHLAEGYRVWRRGLLAISIVTGRKHQIRCHLAHLGHAVVCDGRYAPEALQADLSWCPRNFLHRFRLELPGIDGARFEAACGLPEDLQQVLRARLSIAVSSSVRIRQEPARRRQVGRSASIAGRGGGPTAVCRVAVVRA